MSAEEWPSVDWQAEIGSESGSFKDAVSADISGVFLNEHEFAERRSVRYDRETYENIPVVLNGNRQTNRFLAKKDPVGRPTEDHGQGLYLASCILHCALSDLNGVRPEKGTRIAISNADGDYQSYYISASNVEIGMLRLELEAIDQ